MEYIYGKIMHATHNKHQGKLFSCNTCFTGILHFFLNPKYMCLSHSTSLLFFLYPPSLTCLSGLSASAPQPILARKTLAEI